MVILIDFHGTISHTRYWNCSPVLMQDFIQEFLFNKNRQVIEDWMRGQISTQDISDLISHNTNFSSDVIQSELYKSCRHFRIGRKILNAIAKLRKMDQRVILITSNMDCFSAVVRELRLDDHFDAIVNSAEYGLLKEDYGGCLFDIVFEQFNISISDAILIDDSSVVCELFSARGGLARLAANEESVLESLKCPYQLRLFPEKRIDVSLQTVCD